MEAASRYPSFPTNRDAEIIETIMDIVEKSINKAFLNFHHGNHSKQNKIEGFSGGCRIAFLHDSIQILLRNHLDVLDEPFFDSNWQRWPTALQIRKTFFGPTFFSNPTGNNQCEVTLLLN